MQKSGSLYRVAKATYTAHVRHTYASQLLSGGENPLFVAEQMGHRTTEIIMRHYGRWVEQAAEEQQHVFVSSFGQEA
jgi:integrase